jgi:hypothetical protein
LTHTIPLITLFTFIAAITSYLIIALLRVAVKPVLMGTSVAVPTIMIIAAAWAFAGSFTWTGKEGGWAETVGFVLHDAKAACELTFEQTSSFRHGTASSCGLIS